MAEPPRELGIVGLGRMGGGLARQALDRGFRVAGYSLGGAPPELVAAGLVAVDALDGFCRALRPPRAILLYVPAGKAVDATLDGLAACLEPGDVIADGGNSYWGDSVRRHARLAPRGIGFVDLGTSGGVAGARSGACFMAGGDPAAVARLEPIMAALAVPNGWAHVGPPGAGHFAKLVHNGIEFGMLQAIAEGVALLERRGEVDVAATLRVWRHGSVIRSWLVDLMEEAYRTGGGLEDVPRYVEDTGEVNWLVGDALAMELAIPVIAQAVMQLFASRDETGLEARAIAAMRHGFGGYPFGPDPAIARERREARVGELMRGAGPRPGRRSR